MKNRFTTKFNELLSDLRNGHASKPYSNTGMHLVRMICCKFCKFVRSDDPMGKRS